MYIIVLRVYYNNYYTIYYDLLASYYCLFPLLLFLFTVYIIFHLFCLKLLVIIIFYTVQKNILRQLNAKIQMFLVIKSIFI